MTLRGDMTCAVAVLAGILVVSGCSQQDGRTGMGSRSETGTRMETARTATTSGAPVALTGAQEVPPVNTTATGTTTITVVGDKTLVGRVDTSNLDATAAHIHQAPMGQNGPVVITLVKVGDNAWTVPSNTVLSSAQYDAFRRGELYVNVHSAANPNGEIRAQLKP